MREIIFFIASFAGAAVMTALAILLKPESPLWKLILWGGIAVFAACSLVLLIDFTKPGVDRRILSGLGIGLTLVIGCAISIIFDPSVFQSKSVYIETTKPHLMISISGGNIFIPASPDMRDRYTGIALNAKIWNVGEPSVATEWNLLVIPKGKEALKAQITKIPEHLQLNGEINSAVIRSSDALDEKTKVTTIENIPVEGTLLFYVPLTKHLVLEPSTRLELSVNDIYGTKTVVTQLMGDWMHR